MACLLTNDLRDAVLQYALEGCLTRTLNSDTPVNNTIELYKQEKESILTSKNMKDRNSFSDINNDEILFNIPETWSWIRINDIGVYKKGPFGSALTKSMFVKKDVNTVKVYEQKNAIQKDATLGSYYITEEYYNKKMKGFSVVPGDIIVSCAGTIGEIYIVPEGSEMGIINQALMRMNIVPSVNIDYFMLVFNHILKEEARKNSGGTAIKNIPPFEVFKAMPIPIPPIEEQARIVAKVDEIMAKIDEYEKLENQLVKLKKQFPQDMRDSLLQAGMMGKLTEQLSTDTQISTKLQADLKGEDILPQIPNSWVWTTLPLLVDKNDVGDGDWVLSNDMCEISNNNLIQLGSIGNGIYIDKPFKHVSDLFFESKKCSEIYPEDILISRFICKDFMNACVVPNLDGRLFTSVDVCWIRNNPSRYFNHWLKLCLLSQVVQSQVAQYVSGTTRPRISKTNLMKIYIPLSPIEEQQRIVDKLDELLPLVDKLADLN